jgi:agmatinase
MCADLAERLSGADAVEVVPPFDHASITAVAAAHCAYDLISIVSRQVAATQVS